MPVPTIFSLGRPLICLPKNSIVPPLMGTSPAIARSVVLLPAPFAPMSVTMLFSGTVKDIPLTASMPP